MIVSHPPETIRFIVNSSTDQISLSCTVEGEGVVYWEKDGVQISDSEKPIVPGGNTLVIAPDSNVTTSVGMYRCIASNIVGSVMSSSTSATVTGKWYYACMRAHTHAHTHTRTLINTTHDWIAIKLSKSGSMTYILLIAPVLVGWETYVTGPAKIDHVSANYTKLYFC